MADIVLRQDGQLPIPTQICYKDVGDGTYALVGAAVLLSKNCEGCFQFPLVDSDQGAWVVVSEHEHALHESQRFKASFVQPHGGELANDASRNFLVLIGAVEVHARMRLDAGGDCEVLIFETPTTTEDGTLINSVSKNREVVGTSLTRIYYDPTVTVDGTLLFHWFSAGGSGPRATGGAWGDTHWVLASNTSYLFRVTNRSGAGIQFALGLGWSEQ